MKLFLAMGLLLPAGLLCGPAYAQQGAVPAAGELVERYAPAAEISGSPVMGLVVSGAVDPALRRITARIPAVWEGATVCARMVSSDGRYEAERAYLVPTPWTGGLASLDFPTRYSNELGVLGDDELGVMVTLGACGSDAGANIVPAGWNSIELSGGAALLVNSFRADETYLLVPELDLDISCTPLESDRRTAFDTICALPESLVAHQALVTVELNRIRRGAMMNGDVFSIDLR